MTEKAEKTAPAEQPAAPPLYIGPETAAGGGAPLALRSAEFRKGREAGWRRLEELLNRIDRRGLAALSAEEARELPLLYRAAMSSLSVARAIALDRNLLLYLEDLGLRAYLAVYGPRVGALENLGAFFRSGFPRAVRGLGRRLAAAFLALAVGCAAGYVLVQADLNNFDAIVPADLADDRGPQSDIQDLKDSIFAPWPGFVDTFVVFANSLFRHNTIVGLMAFGLGAALGVPTVLLLIYNGLMLGAFIALHVERGLGLDFVAWLSIHGVTEITAILLCGAAGLTVAEKILFPGPWPRLESLARSGRQAAGVAAGAVALFFVAGLLEGGFRQLINNTPGRLVFALATLALWLTYFTLAGRRRRAGPGPNTGEPPRRPSPPVRVISDGRDPEVPGARP